MVCSHLSSFKQSIVLGLEMLSGASVIASKRESQGSRSNVVPTYTMFFGACLSYPV